MEAVERIRQERVVAVLRARVDVDALGTAVVEVTMHVEDAFTAIRQLRERVDLTVLAGTVRTGPEARAAIEAGAQAIVSLRWPPSAASMARPGSRARSRRPRSRPHGAPAPRW